MRQSIHKRAVLMQCRTERCAAGGGGNDKVGNRHRLQGDIHRIAHETGNRAVGIVGDDVNRVKSCIRYGDDFAGSAVVPRIVNKIGVAGIVVIHVQCGGFRAGADAFSRTFVKVYEETEPRCK